ncbi:MAG TPA: septum formation initiator family protein, partial [Mycobacteriales bacterium]|nr:septum formation initiator family protein [Mycobacteriales bacterium]
MGADARATRAGSPLTTRAALLLLVLCTLVVSAALPLRTFLEQRGRIADLEQEQAAARERVAALEHAKQQLQDPAFLAAEARRRLHMARPGEVSYVLVTPTPTPAPAAETEAPQAGPEAP